MTDRDFDAGAFVDQMAQAVGIAIDPVYRTGVVDSLRASYEGARLLLEFAMPDDVEPVAVYEP